MNGKRPLTPTAISKLDRQLLKNSPVTWATRIHLAGYYGLAFSLFVILICFIVPDDARHYITIYNWVVLLGIVSLLAFVFWMIYLLRFNVFKRFGKWGSLDTAKTYLTYFIVIIIIVSWPFIPPVIQSIRANMAYSSDELARDIDDMNVRLCQLESDSIDTRFSKDTFQLRDSVEGGITQRTAPDDANIDLVNLSDYYFINSATLKLRLAAADSSKRINDSLYLIYECPNYRFIYNHSVSSMAAKTKTSMELFRQVLQNKQPINEGPVRAELAGLFSKYSRKHDRHTIIPTYDQYTGMVTPGYEDRIRDKYDLHFVNNSIDNIADKKYRWDRGAIEGALTSCYYIVLTLALLVVIYRHTTRKTFFLSLLSALVLTILTGLFMAASMSSENSFYIWIIFYFIIFCGLAVPIFKSRHRNAVSGIALNLLVFITPFMPLVITAFYYSALRNKYEYSDEPPGYELLFVNEHVHYILAEIGGFALLLIALGSLFQMAYRKWYSLPEQ